MYLLVSQQSVCKPWVRPMKSSTYMSMYATGLSCISNGSLFSRGGLQGVMKVGIRAIGMVELRSSRSAAGETEGTAWQIPGVMGGCCPPDGAVVQHCMAGYSATAHL